MSTRATPGGTKIIYMMPKCGARPQSNSTANRKKQMARKPRIDSTAEIVRIMNAAAKEIVPPASVPLTPEEMGFFDNIVAEFARSELTAHKLEVVAILARTMADLVREQRALQRRAQGGDADVVVKRRKETKAIERDSPLVEDLISRPD